MRHNRQLILVYFAFVLAFLLFGCSEEPQESVPHVEVLAEGLINPLGMAVLPDGSLFIAEEGTGQNDLSAGVSLRTADGQIGRVVSGLPSSLDSGDLSGTPLVAVAPQGDFLYIGSFDAGHLWTMPLGEQPLTLPAEPLLPEHLGKVMEPLNQVKLINPFDITFNRHGVPVVTDATGNGVATESPDGTTRFFHRFAELRNPENEKITIEAVPTGIEHVNAEYYVTLTGGCPFPEGGGELVAIDESRNQRTLVDDLNMPVDVALGPDGTLWVLEFATFTPGASCFSGSGYQQNSGRLSRMNEDGTLETVLDGLNYPGAVLPLDDGSLYISEVFDGRILHVMFGPPGEDEAAAEESLKGATPTPEINQVSDLDDALLAIISRLDLQPNPGQDLREADTVQARLGQDLFFDPLLSGDQNISCATCHHPALAMADGRVLPIGTGGTQLGPERDFLRQVSLGPDASRPRRRRGETDAATGQTVVANPFLGNFVPRNSPTVLNSALLPVQFWDGRVESYALGQEVKTQEDLVNRMSMTDALAAQALFPLTSLHEMAGATLGELAPQQIRRALFKRIASVPMYPQKFAEVYGTPGINAERVAGAIAAFERRFIFTNAPWDRYLRGERDALDDQQKRGALLFFGALKPAVNCAQCHSGDLFTDLKYHNLLVPQLGPGKGHGENGREDWGRSRVSFDRRDQYSFRTPSLRNVELTAPYFHSGAYASLEAVIRHHAQVWDSAANYDPSLYLPPAFYSSVRPFDRTKQGHSVAPALRDGLPLADGDIADLVAFLRALTDEQARDLSAFIPDSVPSGLPLDPLPELEGVREAAVQESTATVPASDPDATTPFGWRFVDGTADSGLAFQHGIFREVMYEDPAAMMGGGMCWIDYDKDGWLDLYLVNSYAEEEAKAYELTGGLPKNGLFRNENGRFEDVSAGSGADISRRGNGCVAADFNQDGWTDLFVTADGPNALLWNQGDGTFVEGAAAAGLDASEWNSVAAVADLNLDGWPDIFVGSFIDLDNPVPRPTGAFPGDYYGLPDHLYLNNGLGADGRVTFRDVAKEAGLEREERALGAIFSDLDSDGDLDLYIANDGQANRLYTYETRPADSEADAPGLGFRYVERTQEAEVGDTGSGMGVAGADYDGDGQFDLFVTNWEAELNAIYRNETADEGSINFRYSTYRIGMRGLGNNMTGWGTVWADFDHDGDVDLLTANGRVPISNRETDPELVRLYGNRLAEGHAGEYREWTKLVGLEEVGPLLSRGAAAADFDNDGDLDVAINQVGGTAVLLRNEGGNEAGHWLEVQLEGFHPGAVVTLTLPDGKQLKREWHAGSSYLASEDPRLHFGLGEATVVEELHVRWVDGRELTLENVGVDKLEVVVAR
jgi:cytochrome c peroxidase